MRQNNQPYILIVEDEQDLLNAYLQILSLTNVEVKAAINGLCALDVIENEGIPTVVFLDLRMPKMDGIEFLERFKPKQHPDTQVILFSNYDMESDIVRARELGAKKYLLKAQINPSELIEIARQSLGQKLEVG